MALRRPRGRGGVSAWLPARYRLVAPPVALLPTTGYVLGMELAPPGPTFHDVAELEGFAAPTGVTVVEDGLYVVRYMVNASVWTLGFLFIGLVESTARTTWDRLPAVPVALPWLSAAPSRRRAVVVAAVCGLLHAGVMVWFAARLGVTFSVGIGWPPYPFGAVGMCVVPAMPLSLLVRHRLVAPATLLTLFVSFDVRAEFSAGVEDPHALYFGGWFLFLGVVHAATGVEYGLRRLEVG